MTDAPPSITTRSCTGDERRVRRYRRLDGLCGPQRSRTSGLHGCPRHDARGRSPLDHDRLRRRRDADADSTSPRARSRERMVAADRWQRPAAMGACRERSFRTSAEPLFQYRDKDLSFTDCTSFAIMRELRLTTVITTDGRFCQVGVRRAASDSDSTNAQAAARVTGRRGDPLLPWPRAPAKAFQARSRVSRRLWMSAREP